MSSERDYGIYTSEQVEQYYSDGYWIEQNFTELLRSRAEEFGSKVFVTDGLHALSFTEVYESSQRLALGLHRKGIGSGQRVAVQLPNWAAYVVAAAALARIGAVMVPIMPIYRRDEVAHVVADADIAAAIAPVEFKGFSYVSMFEDIRQDSPSLATIVAVRADEAIRADLAQRNVDVFEDLVVKDVALESIDDELGFRSHPDDPYVIVYTSGTTSRPKGCVHTFNTYASGARALVTAFGHTENDVQFGPSPITHTTGLVTSVLVPLMVGAATHVMSDWSPERGLEDIEKFRCTMAVTATTFLQTLISAADENPQADLSSLRAWTCAGSPIPASVVERAKAKLPEASILSLYGRSENLTTTTCTIADDPQFAIISDGSALPGASVVVVDESGAQVPQGTEGDVAYRGPSHMLRYLNRPEETAEIMTAEGYSRSGDLGIMNEHGFVRVTGRLKDIIIRGGMNISVREVEDKLADHPDLSALAVVAMPDERLGEKVCCYVVAKPGHTAPNVEQLRQYLVDRNVAIQKTPERVIAIDELPMTATGKIQKHVLRKQVAVELNQPTSAGAS